jgi:hypothetical protein
MIMELVANTPGVSSNNLTTIVGNWTQGATSDE